MLDDDVIVEAAPAKLNLALHVRARRADGYHQVETLFAFARHGDVVTIAPDGADSFVISGPFAAGLERNGGNLVTRAARAFVEAFAPGAHHAITLEKKLPIASGIGGGSADAAATLRALARLHGIASDTPELTAIAGRLGADVVPCLAGRTALGTGRGDDLQPLEALGDVPAVLVNPGVTVSTATVFGAWEGVDHGPIVAEGTPLERARAGRNDLAAPAIAARPVIRTVLDALAASETGLVRMSGSGATCFALYDSMINMRSAADGIRRDHPDWWVLETAVV